MGLIHDNPARNVRKFAVSSEGFHSWSESDVAAFEAKHKPGSRAHLALSLLLYTGSAAVTWSAWDGSTSLVTF
jgi:hypothetical protein